MRVLVACEYSGRVRDAFLKMGHDAMSCDLLPTESPGPHYQGDVFDVIGDGWDLMIAHPPCTYLTYAGNRHWSAPGRAEKREEALAFFKRLYRAPVPRKCLENPVGYVNSVFRQPDQIIEPYYFGDPFKKRTCLWLVDLAPLDHAAEDTLFMNKTHVDVEPAYYRPDGKAIHFTEAVRPDKDRWKIRSATFPGIAAAMARQWG